METLWGIEIVARYRGPGIPAVIEAIEGNYSTGCTLGFGLGYGEKAAPPCWKKMLSICATDDATIIVARETPG